MEVWIVSSMGELILSPWASGRGQPASGRGFGRSSGDAGQLLLTADETQAVGLSRQDQPRLISEACSNLRHNPPADNPDAEEADTVEAVFRLIRTRTVKCHLRSEQNSRAGD